MAIDSNDHFGFANLTPFLLWRYLQVCTPSAFLLQIHIEHLIGFPLDRGGRRQRIARQNISFLAGFTLQDKFPGGQLPSTS
jgi:hypothetical protein